MIVSEEAEKYASQYSGSSSILLQEIAAYTASHPHAHMMSSGLQVKLLAMLVKFLQPKTILEIGTFTGYATVAMAEAMPSGGEIHTIESREDDAKMAKHYFEKGNFPAIIKSYCGDARQIIPMLKLNWDLVFIDADKTGYIDYYELTLPQLNQNGCIIADNVLFHGQVFMPEVTGKNAKAIHAFNEHVAADVSVEQVMLTVRDGLTLIRKK